MSSSKATRALTDSHVSFITMPDSAQGSNKHLRIGGQSKILMYSTMNPEIFRTVST